MGATESTPRRDQQIISLHTKGWPLEYIVKKTQRTKAYVADVVRKHLQLTEEPDEDATLLDPYHPTKETHRCPICRQLINTAACVLCNTRRTYRPAEMDYLPLGVRGGMHDGGFTHQRLRK